MLSRINKGSRDKLACNTSCQHTRELELRLKGRVPVTESQDFSQTCTVRIVIRTTQVHGVQRQELHATAAVHSTDTKLGRIRQTHNVPLGSDQQSTEVRRGNRDSTYVP